MSNFYNIQIEYTNANWNEIQVKEWLAGIDCQIYNNRSSTFALPPLELMSCGIPTIAIPYSGPKDYCNNNNSLLIDFDLVNVSEDIEALNSVGCRNYFLAFGYKNHPVWAKSKIESVSTNLLRLEKDINKRNSLSANGIFTAKSMSWEKSSLQLSKLLERWF